jgi:hypothetical protein
MIELESLSQAPGGSISVRGDSSILIFRLVTDPWLLYIGIVAGKQGTGGPKRPTGVERSASVGLFFLSKYASKTPEPERDLPAVSG